MTQTVVATQPPAPSGGLFGWYREASPAARRSLWAASLGWMFDAFDVIKWKELYEIVELAIDCCEDIANIVHGIVIKNA